MSGSATNFIIVARSDGRGGFYPFGTYGAAQAGANVEIGNKIYKVTTDGRVSIPKSIMERYGELNAEGRRVIHAQFRTQRAANPKDTWRNVQLAIKRPSPLDINKTTGSKPSQARRDRGDDDELLPRDGRDQNWSSIQDDR